MTYTRYPDPHRRSLARLEHMEDGIEAAAGGGGGEVLTSQRAIAQLSGFCTALVAGQADLQTLTLDSGIYVATGEDYWGVPGSALPLDMQVIGGTVTYPDDAADHLFDVVTKIGLNCNPADAGKLISARAVGNDGTATTLGVVGATGFLTMSLAWIDELFVGDTGATLRAELDVSALTQAPTALTRVEHTLIRR